MTEKPHLTLADVVNIAQTTTLANGGHVPALIVEGSYQTVALALDTIGPTFMDRQEQMLFAGLALARSGEVGVLQQVFFISEGWMSIASEDRPIETLPSQDPRRKEILMVSRLALPTRTAEIILFEMKRDDAGQLTALEKVQTALPEKEGRVEAPLLEAFAIGFLGIADLSDK